MTMLHKNNIDYNDVPNNMNKKLGFDGIFGHLVNSMTSLSYKSFQKLSVEIF